MGIRRIVPMAVGLFITSVATAAPGDTELLSRRASRGTAAGGFLLGTSVDARFVLFSTGATDVVPGGNVPGLILKDRLTGTTELVNVGSTGVPSNDGADDADVSADGRYVVFSSYDDTLVPGDTNGTSDVFLRDRSTRRTVRLSVSAAGVQGDGPSDTVRITPDGRFVLFVSTASTLVPGDTNDDGDVFLRDLRLGTLQRVSVTSTGRQLSGLSNNSSISDDGRYVAFQSWASDVVPRDTNAAPDIFVRDGVTGIVERVSVSSTGAQGTDPSWPGSQAAYISGDGRCVVFNSFASNLVPGDTNGKGDVFIHDRISGDTERVSVSSAETQGTVIAWAADVSGDGRFVLFQSAATNLAPGDLNGQDDLFLRDRQAGTTVRVNVSSLGEQANATTYFGMVSADGSTVVFTTEASNFAEEDRNSAFDVYQHEMGGAGSSVSFTLSPAVVEFGKLTLNTSRGMSVILSNTSGSALTIADVSVTGTDATLFKSSHDCGAAVAAGSACLIRVAFRASSLGDKTARVRVTAGADVVRSVSLAGTGVPAVIDVSPGTLAFGTVAVGSTSLVQVVTIRNLGEAPVPVAWIGLRGPDDEDFRSLRACPSSLGPGRTCHGYAIFVPASKGGQGARLVVSIGASGPRRSVELTGTGN